MQNLIFKAIVGSQSYGTSLPTSDIDYKGVYVQSIDELISFGYKEQFDIGKDECYYEVRRFLQLLQSANPTVLELLYSPHNCIVECHPVFKLLMRDRTKFLTKKCLQSFGGYAVAQIKKAKGLNKKMNWERGKIERKTPIDFIHVYENGKTIPLSKWLFHEDKKQEFCGLVGLDHFRDCYALYYDHISHFGYSEHRGKKPLGFHGICFDDSNTVRVSSVPKDIAPVAIVCYNKDGYSVHCKDYLEYTKWLENRNTQRYVDIENHDQKIDGKNLLHCRRLLDMAIEIATDKTINVYRPNRDELLNIRQGKYDLNKILKDAEKDLESLSELYEKSGLPDEVDKKFVNDLLLEVRESYYNFEKNS